jgi:hypothetical protein
VLPLPLPVLPLRGFRRRVGFNVRSHDDGRREQDLDGCQRGRGGRGEVLVLSLRIRVDDCNAADGSREEEGLRNGAGFGPLGFGPSGSGSGFRPTSSA